MAEKFEHETSIVPSFSRDEMNLAEFPLAVLSTRVDPKVKTLEFRDVQRLKTGEIVEREWVITGADKFGLPTSTDDDVILGLIRLTMDNGFRERKVFFTRYELLKILQWSTEGRSYQRLTRSLDRLSGVRIKATNAFFDNSNKAYQTCNFGIIDAYEINSERSAGRSDAPTSYFIWSEMLFDSFRVGFIKKLDLNLYFSLESAVSRRLYRYLDKHFYYRAVVEKPLTLLAFEKLGLARTYRYASSIKQQLEPALEELKKSGFIERFEYAGQGSDTIIRLFRGVSSAAQEVLEASREVTPSHFRSPTSASKVVEDTLGSSRAQKLYGELVQRGIAAKQATKLLLNRSERELAQIVDILRYYDFLLSARDQKVSKNPVGFLYRAVERPMQFIVPKNFSTRSSHEEASSSDRVFPARQLYNSRKSDALDGDLARKNYEKYRTIQIKEFRERLSPERLREIYGSVEQKVSRLRRVLSAARFEEALEGGVRDELARLAQIEDYRYWLAKQQ